ncbi:MAG: hypothetical protein ACXV95_05815, partial [Acidimicrobiales bacterium]
MGASYLHASLSPARDAAPAPPWDGGAGDGRGIEDQEVVVEVVPSPEPSAGGASRPGPWGP